MRMRLVSYEPRRKDGSESVLLRRLRNNGYFHLSHLGISELRDRVWSHFIEGSSVQRGYGLDRAITFED